MDKLKCASFFSGVGGIDEAFIENDFDIVYANELDKYAVKTYQENFKLKVDNRDIKEVKASEIPDFDIMIAGFPCQAFSIAGKREGFKDSKGRGELFFELVRILKEKKPIAVFFENVKNLTTHDNGNTFKVILAELKKLGYNVTYKVLNACEYGNIPQNRERIYIVGFLEEAKFNLFKFPEKLTLTKSLKDVLNYKTKEPDKYYYTKGKFKGNIYEELKKEMTDKYSVYQWRRHYVRQNKSHVCPCLTANCGEGGHNVPLILTDFGIRKLTPKECFNLQGYKKSYKFPKDMLDSKLYKQAGNSVVIPVIKRIAKEMKRVL